MIPETLKALQIPIESLRPYGRNPRQGDVGAIVQSLERHGQYRPIVVNARTQEVLAGNHTLRAAQELGWREIAATFVDVDEDQAARIVLVDNRSNDLASYDDVALSELLRDLPDLEGTGYTPEDLDELLRVLEPAGQSSGDTDAGEVPEEPRTKPGDLYLLGGHRLLCGDATDSLALERLLDGEQVACVYTDPPYGVSIVRDSRIGGDNVAKTTMYRPVIGDDTTDAAVAAYRLCVALEIPTLIFWGANYYADSLPPSACWLVWDKRGEMASNNFADCELAWTNLTGPARIHKQVWAGMIREGESGSRVHPTQKPVGLAEWAISELSLSGSILDSFCGSGSTLIACENLNRRCYAMELDPGYCDVIVDRWERHTSQTATLERSDDASEIEAHA
jgi:hypothetical protein